MEKESITKISAKPGEREVVIVTVIDAPRELVFKTAMDPKYITYEERDGKTIITDRSVFQSVEDRDGMLKTGMEKGSVETLARFDELVKRIQYEQLGTVSSGNKGEVVIVRYFDAPVEQLWKAWTEPERMKRWWGPKDFTSPVIKIEFRVGGKYLLDMRGPDGKDYWSTGIYEEIAPMKRIVVKDSFSDKDGKIVPASYYRMAPGFPLQSQMILTFEGYGDKTKITIRYPDLGELNAKDLENMKQGWSQQLDKLEGILRASTIEIER